MEAFCIYEVELKIYYVIFYSNFAFFLSSVRTTSSWKKRRKSLRPKISILLNKVMSLYISLDFLIWSEYFFCSISFEKRRFFLSQLCWLHNRKPFRRKMSTERENETGTLCVSPRGGKRYWSSYALMDRTMAFYQSHFSFFHFSTVYCNTVVGFLLVFLLPFFLFLLQNSLPFVSPVYFPIFSFLFAMFSVFQHSYLLYVWQCGLQFISRVSIRADSIQWFCFPFIFVAYFWSFDEGELPQKMAKILVVTFVCLYRDHRKTLQTVTLSVCFRWSFFFRSSVPVSPSPIQLLRSFVHSFHVWMA